MSWTLSTTIEQRSKNYIMLKLHCLSDGNALAATNILAETVMERDTKRKIQGLSLMRIKADPGAANQPDQAWDFTLYDRDGDELLTITDTSATDPTYHDASSDIGSYPTVFDRLYIAFPTAADWTSGDTADLFFEFWKESGAV